MASDVRAVGRSQAAGKSTPSFRFNGIHRAVIFDLDDTLISWQTRSRNAQRYVAELLTSLYPQGPRVEGWMAVFLDGPMNEYFKQVVNGELDQEVYHRMRFQRALHHAGLYEDADQVEALFQTYRSHMILNARLDAGILPLLDALRRRYKMGLITNGCESFQLPTLRRTGLDRRFDLIYIANELRLYKPFPGIYRRMLAELEMSPHQVVMVGDNYAHDIEAAASLGMDTIWVNTWGEEVAGRDVPSAVVDHVLDLHDLLAEV